MEAVIIERRARRGKGCITCEEVGKSGDEVRAVESVLLTL
jgi:hypothetical protein